MSKFKVGDRVCRTTDDNCDMIIGDLGTVVDICDREPSIKVVKDGPKVSYWHSESCLQLIEQSKFEVGDKVSWCGAEGVVSKVYLNYEYPIEADFTIDFHFFTSDGKLWDWHKEPSLIMIEKFKPLKKEIEVDGNIDVVVLPGEFMGNKVKVTFEEIK